VLCFLLALLALDIKPKHARKFVDYGGFFLCHRGGMRTAKFGVVDSRAMRKIACGKLKYWGLSSEKWCAKVKESER